MGSVVDVGSAVILWSVLYPVWGRQLPTQCSPRIGFLSKPLSFFWFPHLVLMKKFKCAIRDWRTYRGSVSAGGSHGVHPRQADRHIPKVGSKPQCQSWNIGLSLSLRTTPEAEHSQKTCVIWSVGPKTLNHESLEPY